MIIGDLVQLKSGGPCMTVSHIREREDKSLVVAICQWFDESQNIHSEPLRVEMLKPWLPQPLPTLPAHEMLK